MAIKISGETVIDDSRTPLGFGVDNLVNSGVTTTGAGKFSKMSESFLEVVDGKIRLNIQEVKFNCDATSTSNCANCNCDCRC